MTEKTTIEASYDSYQVDLCLIGLVLHDYW